MRYTVSEGQESKSKLPGWFQLRVSHELLRHQLVCLQSSQTLIGVGRFAQGNPFTRLLAGGLGSLPCGSPHRAVLNVLIMWQLASPRASDPSEQGKVSVPTGPNMVTYHHFCLTLLSRIELFTAAQLKGSGIKLCLSKKKNLFIVAVVVQSFSHVQLFATPWTIARQASLSFSIS